MPYRFLPPLTKAEQSRRYRLRQNELPDDPERCQRAVLDLIRSAHFTIPEMLRILGLTRGQLSALVAELGRQGHRIRELHDRHGRRYALFVSERCLA